MCVSSSADGNISSFLADFDNFLGDIFLADRILLSGDLNIHLDVSSKYTNQFNDVIELYGLYQFSSLYNNQLTNQGTYWMLWLHFKLYNTTLYNLNLRMSNVSSMCPQPVMQL